MGRDARFYCKTCRKEYYLGYGSYSTWLDGARTVEEFDKMVEARPDLADLLKNQNMRKCLEEHSGHEIETHSNDWTYVQNGVLYGEFGPMGAGVPLVEDYEQWEHIDLDPK